jgi:glycosyltransferase involved in cell wall biosynthesis
MLLQDYPNIELVIVNYNSPDGLSGWLSQNFADQLSSGKLVEVTVPKVHYFNHPHSRNVGLRAAHGEWVFFIDADCKPAPTLISHLLRRIDNLSDVFATIGTPAFGAVGSIFAKRQDLIDLGGYMEDLSGWGYEDGDLKDRLFLAGKEMFSFLPKLLPSLDNTPLEKCMYLVPPFNIAHEKENWQRDMYNRNYLLSKKYIEENGIVANKDKEWGKGGINTVNPVGSAGKLKAVYAIKCDTNGITNLAELKEQGCPQKYIDKVLEARSREAFKETVILEHNKLKLTQIQDKKLNVKPDDEDSMIVEVPYEKT